MAGLNSDLVTEAVELARSLAEHRPRSFADLEEADLAFDRLMRLHQQIERLSLLHERFEPRSLAASSYLPRRLLARLQAERQAG